jgi:hypothetical protein
VIASTPSGDSGARKERDVCTVAVIYEDLATRRLAIRLCDRLFQDFQGDLDFEITWWGAKYIGETEIAREAAAAAAGADVVVVCFQPEGDFAPETRVWFESWALQRELPDGALVAVAVPADRSMSSASKGFFLRLMAERARLEFLEPKPEPAGGAMPPTETKGMGNILGTPDSESQTDQRYWGWGINE